MENGSSHDPKSESYANGSLNNEFDPSSGRNQTNSFNYRPFLAPIKVFRCKYCGRKFLNSRALGGHQNAHKKERTLWVMGLSNHKSLGMVPHALPDKPVQEKSSTGKAKESFKSFQDAWRQQISVQAADQDDLRWPGSFRVDSADSIHREVTGTPLKDLVLSPKKPDQSKVRVLDLNLRLGYL